MQIHNVTIERAITMLNAANAQFKIITQDGSEFGTLEVKEIKERKRKPNKYPYGTLKAYFIGYVDGLQPKDAIAIPFGRFEPEELRGPICAWCCTHWGKGSINTVINKELRQIEILRLK